MRYVSVFFLILEISTSTALASDKAELVGARAWVREYVDSSLSDEQMARSSRSYREAALEVWTTYVNKYAQLTKVHVPELTDEQLLASAEVFTTMASVGTGIARNSEHYPEVRKTAAAALAIYEEITSRRKPSYIEAVMTYSAVFSLREWELESRMRGPLQTAPYIVDDPSLGTKRSLWFLDPDFYTMKRVSFELTEDTKWIVIAFAECAVAKEAVSDIISDEALMGLLAQRSLWLTAPGSDSQSFPGVFIWNARYPQFPLKFIHHMDEWPMLDMRPDSPTFVRIEKGAVVGVHSGWGSGKYLPRSRKALLDIEAKAQ